MMPANGTDPKNAHQAENETERMAESITEVLDVGDVAEMFKCSREKIKRMARRGELPAFKFGKHWYLRKDDLERFLSGRVELSGHLRRIQEV
jgi:excisionase family DNA binding protein